MEFRRHTNINFDDVDFRICEILHQTSNPATLTYSYDKIK